MKKLNSKETNDLLDILRRRFKANMALHKGVDWDEIETKLKANPTKLSILQMMDETGGEPDVINYDKKSKEITFADTSPESPKDRRSLCYDEAALKARKANKPKGSAMGWIEDVGVELMDEKQYRELQKLVPVDTKSSSWLKTPDEIRKLGGAIFGDRRYNTVFIFHNGADSYYGERGFRAIFKF